MVAIRPRRQSIQHMSFRLGATISGFIREMHEWQASEKTACTFQSERVNIIRIEPGDDRIAALHRAHNHVTCPKCLVLLDELLGFNEVNVVKEKQPAEAQQFEVSDDLPF